jgi:hypothetical protein
MSEIPQRLTPEELALGRQVVADLNRHNVFCHCRVCDREWVASQPEPCRCGSKQVEAIACWQFPDG